MEAWPNMSGFYRKERNNLRRAVHTQMPTNLIPQHWERLIELYRKWSLQFIAGKICFFTSYWITGWIEFFILLHRTVWKHSFSYNCVYSVSLNCLESSLIFIITALTWDIMVSGTGTFAVKPLSSACCMLTCKCTSNFTF